MKTIIAALAATVMLASPALADGKIYVQLPDLSGFSGAAAERLLTEVVLANVISSNCPDLSVTDAEWSLLADSADMLARGQLGLSIEDYDWYFYRPAFNEAERHDRCEVFGPDVRPVIDRLVELGGSREALPDQDAAYQQDLARQAAWDQATEQPGKTKTK